MRASVMDAYILFTVDLNKRIIYYFIRARIIDMRNVHAIFTSRHMYVGPYLTRSIRGVKGGSISLTRGLAIDGFEAERNRPMVEPRNHF